jgi:nucleoside 2-deoxyribosyltransferase
MGMAHRVYLAGPDVFLANPQQAGELKKRLCATYGFEGVFPLDAELKTAGLDLREIGLRISAANEHLIQTCQLVIAQITPFRGPSADVGTAYEMGYARALGLPIYAYTNVEEDFLARTRDFVGATHARAGGAIEDTDGLELESFRLVDNLMLAGAIELSGGCLSSTATTPANRYTQLSAFEQCLRVAREAMRSPRS